MVNWEQVINEMELPGLRDEGAQRPMGVAYVSDGDGGWTRLPGAWSFIPPTADPVVTSEMLDKAVEWSLRIGPERFEAELQFQADQATLDYFRKMYPPIDNDIL